MYNLLKAMHILYFYPRPPRGGRRLRDQQARHAEGISIHALREEGDGEWLGITDRQVRFLSTPSARRATQPCPCK